MSVLIEGTLVNSQINAVPYCGLAIDSAPGVGVSTQNPALATRVQCFFPNGAALLGNVPSGSNLKVYADNDRNTILAEWIVGLEPSPFFNSYPLAFHVQSVVSSAGPMVDGASYYFILTTDGATPPPQAQKKKVLLLGDSITHQFQQFYSPLFDSTFANYTATNLGIDGDRTGPMITRINQGWLDPYTPDFICLLIGTNDVPTENATTIVASIASILNALRTKFPNAKIILNTIFPRYDTAAVPGFDYVAGNQIITAVNLELLSLADGVHIKLLDTGAKPEFQIDNKTAYAGDHIHLGAIGYGEWGPGITATIGSWPTGNVIATITTGAPSMANVTSQIIETTVNGGTPTTENVTIGGTRILEVNSGDTLKIRWKDVNSVGQSEVWSDDLTVTVPSFTSPGVLPGKAGVGQVSFAPNV